MSFPIGEGTPIPKLRSLRLSKEKYDPYLTSDEGKEIRDLERVKTRQMLADFALEQRYEDMEAVR